MYLENRLIAMLDVLGLSKKLKTKAQLIETSAKYSKLIQEAKSEIFSSNYATETPTSIKKSNFEIGEFVFDNLILVSHEITPETASQFSLAIIRLMQKFATHDMPLRGAISVGDYCHDEESKVFLSDTFKILSHEENNQQWTGCVVTKEAENVIKGNVSRGTDFTLQKSEQAYIYMPVPWKEGSESRLCLNWMHTMCNTTKTRLFKYLADDKQKHEGTLKGFEFSDSIENINQKLPREWHPVRYAKFITTCSHIKPYFYDKKMNLSAPKNKSLEFVLKAYA